jgi:hypothetical protein
VTILPESALGYALTAASAVAALALLYAANVTSSAVGDGRAQTVADNIGSGRCLVRGVVAAAVVGVAVYVACLLAGLP